VKKKKNYQIYEETGEKRRVNKKKSELTKGDRRKRKADNFWANM